MLRNNSSTRLAGLSGAGGVLWATAAMVPTEIRVRTASLDLMDISW